VRVTNNATPAFATGLAELAPAYRALLCDVWGVVHNGVQAYPDAIDALTRYRALGGVVLLITNAPRRKAGIQAMFDKMGVPPDVYDDILSSGDATRDYLAKRIGTRIYHLGPERDLSIYEGLPHVFGDEDDCEVVCCTGYFDDETEGPDDYQERLAAWRARDVPMICANPDIVVERGGRMVWCAGAMAQRYRELGGETVMIGKPHALVYEAALERISAIAGEAVPPQSVLAIGDALGTDVRGAIGQGLDLLFITGGIHADEFGSRDAPDLAKVRERLATDGLAARAVMPRLVWGNGQ
jgi:HAD superfamily hydrolase (TIGR01459 family)